MTNRGRNHGPDEGGASDLAMRARNVSTSDAQELFFIRNARCKENLLHMSDVSISGMSGLIRQPWRATLYLLAWSCPPRYISHTKFTQISYTFYTNFVQISALGIDGNFHP